MKKAAHLFLALSLMTLGWTSAFVLASRPFVSQGFWLFPAVILGAGIGLSLRHVNGRQTALMLVVSAAVGLTMVNLFFPDNRVSLDGLRRQFRGTNGFATFQVKIDERYQSPPFDQPLALTSPIPLDLSLFSRFPAGVDDFCFSPSGTLYASLPALGAVYRVEQVTSPEHSEPQIFLSGLDHPSGLLCDSTQIVVAESSKISRYNQVGKAATTIVDNLPADGGALGHHLQMIPQGLLFSVGSRCDACEEKNALRGTVQIVTRDGKVQPYATGLRNLGGIAFTPEDNLLWASERSRKYPQPGAADELNNLVAGGDYGWPECEGIEPSAVKNSHCPDSRNAESLLRSRANPAGLMFTRGLAFPAVYRNSVLVVLQGDRTSRILPALVRIPLVEGKAGSPVAFLGGWDGVKTRPSAIHEGHDGAIYIADDISGAIYRAAWRGEQ